MCDEIKRTRSFKDLETLKLGNIEENTNRRSMGNAGSGNAGNSRNNGEETQRKNNEPGFHVVTEKELDEINEKADEEKARKLLVFPKEISWAKLEEERKKLVEAEYGAVLVTDKEKRQLEKDVNKERFIMAEKARLLAAKNGQKIKGNFSEGYYIGFDRKYAVVQKDDSEQMKHIKVKLNEVFDEIDKEKEKPEEKAKVLGRLVALVNACDLYLYRRYKKFEEKNYYTLANAKYTKRWSEVEKLKKRVVGEIKKRNPDYFTKRKEKNIKAQERKEETEEKKESVSYGPVGEELSTAKKTGFGILAGLRFFIENPLRLALKAVTLPFWAVNEIVRKIKIANGYKPGRHIKFPGLYKPGQFYENMIRRYTGEIKANEHWYDRFLTDYESDTKYVYADETGEAKSKEENKEKDKEPLKKVTKKQKNLLSRFLKGDKTEEKKEDKKKEKKEVKKKELKTENRTENKEESKTENKTESKAENKTENKTENKLSEKERKKKEKEEKAKKEKEEKERKRKEEQEKKDKEKQKKAKRREDIRNNKDKYTSDGRVLDDNDDVKVFDPVDYPEEQKAAYEKILTENDIPVFKSYEEVSTFRGKNTSYVKVGKRLKTAWKKEISREAVNAINWISSYYVSRDKTRIKRGNIKKLEIPAHKYKLPDADIDRIKAANEQQDYNNCFCCSGAISYNQFLFNEKNKTGSQEDINLKLVNQHQIRGFKPVYINEKKFVADYLKSLGMPENDKEMAAEAKQIYRSYYAETDTFAGEGKEAVGNLYEIADFFLDKQKDIAMHKMELAIPSENYKTREKLNNNKYINIEYTQEEKKEADLKFNNMKAVFLGKVHEILQTGNTVSILTKLKGTSHYMTITGMDGENISYVDSLYPHEEKTNNISYFFGRENLGQTVQINWFSRVGDINKLKKDFDNLSYDEKKGFSLKTPNTADMLYVAHSKGISTSREVGVDGVSEHIYLPKEFGVKNS